MTEMYTVVAQIDAGAQTNVHILALAEDLAPFHAAVSLHAGRLSIRLSMPGEDIAAVALAASSIATLALLRADIGAHPIVRLEVQTEAEFNRREGFCDVPELVGVPEIADELHVSNQAIQQQIDAGRWSTAKKVGKFWVIARSELEARKAASAGS